MINRRHLLNVIFGDVVMPHLATLGASLTRVELDAGKRINQIMSE